MRKFRFPLGLLPRDLRSFLYWHFKRFGVAPNKAVVLRAWLQKVVGFSRHPIVSIPVLGMSRKVWVRIGTTDIDVYDQVFVRGDYQFHIENPCSIVDAGANTGLSTLYFANKFPSALIIAIEPEPQNFEMLKMNVAGLSNVRVMQVGLWSRRTRLKVVNKEADAWAFQFQECNEMEGIEAISIEDLLELVPSGCIDLLKVDIEGGERFVFKSGASWVRSVRAIAIECHDWLIPGCSDAVYSCVCGYLDKEIAVGENKVLYLSGRPESVE